MAATSGIASMYAFPWDFHDEGMERTLAMLADKAGMTEVAVACVGVAGTYFLPHNPKRMIYFGEEGALLFQPSVNPYRGTCLEAQVAGVVGSPEYLPGIAAACRGVGLEFTVWMRYCDNPALARAFPEYARQDALGIRHLSQLCPAEPDVRVFCREVTADLCRQCAPDGMHIEAAGFLPYDRGFTHPAAPAPIASFDRLLLGLCFCPLCIAAADAAGLDGDGFHRRVATYLRESLPGDPGQEALLPAPPEMITAAFDGELLAYLNARSDIATSLYEEIAAVARGEGVRHVRTSLPLPGEMALTGLEPTRVLLTSDRATAPLPEPDAPERLQDTRSYLRPGMLLLAAAHPEEIGTGEALRARLHVCRDAGADGFTFPPYGLLREHQVRAIGEARSAWL